MVFYGLFQLLLVLTGGFGITDIGGFVYLISSCQVYYPKVLGMFNLRILAGVYSNLKLCKCFQFYFLPLHKCFVLLKQK